MATQLNTKGTSVLIVEDNPEDAIIMRRALETLRVGRILVTETAEEALDTLERRPADVVLVDYGLPGMNGLALVQRVRELWPEVKVVVVTGLHDEQVAVSVLKAGADDYVAKDKLLTSGVIRSLQAALREGLAAKEQQRRQLLSSPRNRLKVALEEAEWQHDTFPGQRDLRDGALAGIELISYAQEEVDELVTAFAGYLQRSFELFPGPARVQESRLASMLVERSVSAGHVLAIYRASLRLLLVDRLEPPFNPAVCLARILALVVNEQQYRLAAEALQESAGVQGRRRAAA